MEAVQLRQIDMDYRNHLQAFLNFAVRAMKNSGKRKQKPVYSTFKKFYDYQAALRKVQGGKKPDRFAELKRHLKKGGSVNAGKL